MEFPITRARLQNHKYYEAMYMETRQRVLEKVNFICKNVEHIASSTNEMKYIYIFTEEDKGGMLSRQLKTRGILKELLEAVMKLFPDSKVVVDPLETYILIDWS